MLEFLITRYKDSLNILFTEFPESFERNSNMSRRTAEKWIQQSPKKPIKLRSSSREALSDYFKKALPNIPPIWFALEDIEEFKNNIIELEAKTESREYPCLGIPRNKIFFDDIKKLSKDIEGLYVLYRFIFTPKGDNNFIREVLHIYKDKAALKFHSYYATNLAAEDYHSSFHGACLPIGETIHLSGTEWGIYQRSRTFLLRKKIGSISPNKFLFGMLLSSNLHEDMPSSAKVLLMRYTPHDTYPKEKADIPPFAKQLCRYSGDMISEDFKQNSDTVKAVISNQIEKSATTICSPRERSDRLFVTNEIHENWLDMIKLSL